MKKADNVQRKKCENLQKAWRVFAQAHFKNDKTKQRNESWLKTVAQ